MYALGMFHVVSPRRAQDQLQSSTGWNNAVKIAEKVGHCLQQPGVPGRAVVRFRCEERLEDVLRMDQ